MGVCGPEVRPVTGSRTGDVQPLDSVIRSDSRPRNFTVTCHADSRPAPRCK